MILCSSKSCCFEILETFSENVCQKRVTPEKSKTL